jgi:DNA repair exonuclease SbcCD ATPase subunit
MARTPTDADIKQFPVTEVLEKNTAELAVSLNANDIATVLIMDAEEALKMVGRIEAADFLATVAEKMIAETAIALKQDKKYKGLPYKDKNGKWQQVATFAEFCEHKLGKRRRRVDQLIDNYNLLGPELYEQAELIGFRQRDYAALKALPADDRQIIAEAIEAEDLDKALDLMQQMAAKHHREKETTEKQLAELTKDLASKDAVIQKRDQKLNEMDHELERLKLDQPVFAHVDWPAAFKGYVEQVNITRRNLKHAIGSLDVLRESAMKIEPQSSEEEAALNSAKEILATELVGIHNECLDMIEALGLSFDRSLGAYSEARIRLLQG